MTPLHIRGALAYLEDAPRRRIWHCRTWTAEQWKAIGPLTPDDVALVVAAGHARWDGNTLVVEAAPKAEPGLFDAPVNGPVRYSKPLDNLARVRFAGAIVKTDDIGDWEYLLANTPGGLDAVVAAVRAVKAAGNKPFYSYVRDALDHPPVQEADKW